MSANPPPTRSVVASAARLLKMPASVLQEAVDAYFHPPKKGRPRRELNSSEVGAAIEGRTLREAAELIGVPTSTLHDFINKKRK